jgi:hypothetical protein
MDLVPEPTIVAAALRACRRVNDYSLTTRYRYLTFKDLGILLIGMHRISSRTLRPFFYIRVHTVLRDTEFDLPDIRPDTGY